MILFSCLWFNAWYLSIFFSFALVDLKLEFVVLRVIDEPCRAIGPFYLEMSASARTELYNTLAVLMVFSPSPRLSFFFAFITALHLSALYNTTVISILLSIPPQLCCVWKTRLTSDSDYSKSIQSVRVERVRALLCHSYISVARVSLHSLISFFYYHNYCHSTTGRVRATALENKPLFQEQNNSRCLLDIFRFILLFFFQVAHGGKETWRSDGCRANHFNMLAHPSSCFFYIFSSLLFVHSLRVSSVDFYFTLCIRGNQMYDQRKVPERRHGQDCAIHTYSIRCVT